jgi:ABC-type nitrate/sulfonate/bicarbonate transport system substrate-binding protein
MVVQMGGLAERMAGLTSGVVDGAMLNVDQEYQVEKLGYHALIDFRKLPFAVPTQGIVAGKEFVRNNRDNVKNFLKVYVEGIKILKTDKEFSVAVLSRYLKLNDVELLSKTYDVYREAFESVPHVRREGIIQALDTMPEIMVKNPKLNPDQIIDNSILRELENEGFFKELYSDRPRK